MPISVAIAGAGLSGLCLAQALLRAGFDVQVYERDQSRDARRQGYRITVDEHGIAALRKCLPPELFELFIATAGEPKGSFRYLTQDLREIFTLSFPDEPRDAAPRRGRQADRLTLRTLLLSGLESRVHFGKAATQFSLDSAGVTLAFADKTTACADLVVGADGANSPLRQQLLPQCIARDLGSVAICGSTPVVHGGRSLVPLALAHTGVLAAGDPGHAFFLTTMHFHDSPAQAFARLAPGQSPPFVDDYVMWAVIVPTREWSASLLSQSTSELNESARRAATEFHPVLQRLVEHADVEATLAVPIRAARRPRRWAPSRVTLMGDAVHVMPPFGAHGGNTALRDAALLSEKLCAAVASEGLLEDAIGCYQKEMLQYAFEAVVSATSSMKRLNSKNPLMRWAMHHALPWYRARQPGRLIVDSE